METQNKVKCQGSKHHRGSVGIAVALTALLLAAAPSPAHCAPPILKESWVDKAPCHNLGGGNIECDEVSSGQLAVSMVISPFDAGASGTYDPNQMDGTTPFDITIGNFSYSGTLGSDRKYVAGKSQATLLLTGEVCDENDTCKENVKHGHILVSMTKKGLKISLSTLTGADSLGNSYETSASASDFDGQPSGVMSEALSARVDLGDFSYSTDDAGAVLAVTGKVKTKDVTTKDGSDFTLSTVNIAGTIISQP